MNGAPVQVLIFSDTNGALGFGRYAGPYRIATELREHGFRIQVIDFFAEFSSQSVRKIIDRFVGPETLWVGFSTTLLAPGINSTVIKEKIEDGTYNNSFMIENWKNGVFPQEPEEVQDLFAYIRSRSPKVKLVAGGTKAMRELEGDVDYYMWGESDVSAVKLTQYLAGDSSELKSSDFLGGKRVLGDDYPVGDFSE